MLLRKNSNGKINYSGGKIVSKKKAKNMEEIAQDIALPILEELGFELVDVEYKKEGAHWFLRMYIDKPGGITIDDCQEASDRINTALDKNVSVTYDFLEISSPGLDRPLKKDKEFVRYKGRKVDVNHRAPRKMNGEFLGALEQIAKEKGIDEEILINAIEAALLSAYKKNFGTTQNVKINVDRETGTVKVYALKTVVEDVKDETQEILLEDARKIDFKYQLGDMVEIEITPRNFGRIAAQNAKQVVIQRIREAERVITYEKFIEKENEIIPCMVQRVERRNVYVDLDEAEGIMPPNEQISTEDYKVNDRLIVYITEVKMTNKGPQILVSRTHPNLVKRLFEREVPEIVRGEVIIKNIAREAGSRTKVAVYADHPSIDPVGACVGQHGIRVQHIVDELNGEKIDVIRWSDDPREFIGSALSPAKIVDVFIDEAEKSARVIVPDNQLSLAIGKEGQNARLAAKLTGWKIDIKSISQMEEIEGVENGSLAANEENFE